VYEASTGRLTFEEDFPVERIEYVAQLNNSDEWLVVHEPRYVEGQPDLYPYLTRHKWPFRKGGGQRVDLPFDTSVDSCSVSPNGQYAAFSVSQLDQNFQVIALEGMRIIHVETADFISSGNPLQWSKDSLLLTSIRKKEIVFQRSTDFARLAAYPIDKPKDVAISPRGDCIAFGSWGSASRVVPWNDVFPSDR
jgi:hypothetical protein